MEQNDRNQEQGIQMSNALIMEAAKKAEKENYKGPAYKYLLTFMGEKYYGKLGGRIMSKTYDRAMKMQEKMLKKINYDDMTEKEKKDVDMMSAYQNAQMSDLIKQLRGDHLLK